MAGKRLLLVDDDEGLCRSLGVMLERGGYWVDSAADSSEGRRLMEQNTYDAAVVDLRMPGLSGIDLLRRSKVVSPAMKFILITATPSIGEMLRDANLEADAVIMKPFDCETLLDKLKNVFR